MSNERIDQILEETIPFFRANEERSPHYADLIRKAMEQYGGDMYDKGLSEAFTLTNRLQALVQAQKELIALHDKLSESDFLTKKEWMRSDVLRNQIKSLES